MQVIINSDNTATLTVDRNELGVLDYGLGHFVQHAAPGTDCEDIALADAMEQQLWTEYCRLVDQIQATASPDKLWA